MSYFLSFDECPDDRKWDTVWLRREWSGGEASMSHFLQAVSQIVLFGEGSGDRKWDTVWLRRERR